MTASTTSGCAQAQQARQSGLAAVLPAGGIGALRVTGRDAARFLHAQLTNEVQALRAGEGNLTARVRRTGHMMAVIGLRRLPGAAGDVSRAFLLLTLGADSAARLVADLQEFVFADDVLFADVSNDYTWCVVVGPQAVPVLLAARIIAAADPAGTVPPGTVPQVVLPNGIAELSDREQLPDATLLLRDDVVFGDEAYVLALPHEETATPVTDTLRRLETAARAHGMACPTSAEIGDVLDMLRIEAGVVRLDVDMPRRARLLPETGMEQWLVSYSKGCYLGQEVIARVRTYGSVKTEMRGLVLECRSEATDGSPAPTNDDLLDNLPPAGEPLVLHDTGLVIGELASRAIAPATGCALAMAYLDRSHRVPSAVLAINGRRFPMQARVVLLPVYRSLKQCRDAATLYDAAIKTFAAGQHDVALTLLERCLTLDPAFQDGYEAIGVLLGRHGRYEEAISLFKRLAELNPDAPLVHSNLSLFYMKLGDKEAAEEHAAVAMRKSLGGGVASGNTTAVAAKQEAARQQEADRKREMFTRVLAIDAEDPIALFGLGNALSALQQWQEAARVYERAQAVQPHNSALLLARGKALERLGARDAATTVYRQGLAIAANKGDLIPMRELQTRLLLLEAASDESTAQ